MSLERVGVKPCLKWPEIAQVLQNSRLGGGGASALAPPGRGRSQAPLPWFLLVPKGLGPKCGGSWKEGSVPRDGLCPGALDGGS